MSFHNNYMVIVLGDQNVCCVPSSCIKHVTKLIKLSIINQIVESWKICLWEITITHQTVSSWNTLFSIKIETNELESQKWVYNFHKDLVFHYEGGKGRVFFKNTPWDFVNKMLRRNLHHKGSKNTRDYFGRCVKECLCQD